MEEKKNIPEIRFKGFVGEWAYKVFNDAFLNLTNNTLSRADLNYKSGKYKNIHYGDVLIKFSELLDVKNDSVPFITNDILAEKINSSKLQDGDIIIADTAEDESVGKCTELVNIEKEEMVSGLHTIPVRPIDPFASKYLGYYMNSPSYHNQLVQLMQGIKVLSVSKSSIKNTTLVYPSNKEEQSQIGTFFQNLDKQIIYEQKKHDKLVTLKKAMLEKMFPKEGASVPEIRFRGFEKEWEEKQMGEIMNVTSVKRIHQSDWTNTGIRFLRARDIVSVYKNENPSEYLYISKEKYVEYSLISGKVAINDLLVTGVGTIGVPLLIKNEDPIYFKDGNIIWFKNENVVKGNFLYYSFVGNRIQRYINDSAGIGTVGTYTIESGKKTPFYFSTINEQTQIGSYFQNLDKLITLQQQKIDKLKNIKKACLDKMFV